MGRKRVLVQEQAIQEGALLEEGVETVPAGEGGEVEDDRVWDMMEAIQADEPERIKLYLYKAQEKNRALAGPFCQVYTSDIPIWMIQQEARENHGGGDFVVIARKGTQFFKKKIFSTTSPKEGERSISGPPGIPAAPLPLGADPNMQRLTSAMEKRVVLDKLEEMSKGGSGGGAMDALIPMFLKSQMEMQTLLLQMVMDNKTQSGGDRTPISDFVEIAKFVKNLSEGKIEDAGETSLSDSIVKALPGILEAIAERKQVVVPGHPMVPPGRIPPAIPGAAPDMLPPPPPDAPVVDPIRRAIDRILNEIHFCLQQPESDKLYDHLLNYTENYMPGSIDEILGQTADQYYAFILTLDGSFAPREAFFRNLYKYAVSNYSEPPPCENCNGEGIVASGDGTMIQCPECKGTKTKPEGEEK